MNWKKLLFTTLALGLFSATTVYGEQVKMDLFYNGCLLYTSDAADE